MVDPGWGDNDPARLSGSVDRALSRVDRGKPFVLVIDDLHVLHRRAPHDALVALANDLPEAATLAMASRATPPLPLARLRSERMITELGPGELAMTRREAAALFKAAGHDLDHDAIDTAMRRTEGWPASLALAVLFLADRSPASVLDRFSGEDRLVAQYLREEVLSDLASEDVEFMRRTSLADTLTAPLCDSLLHRPGSAAVIERLASAGLVVPLDRTDDRYRYRRPLGEMLHAELRKNEPVLAQEIHRRAGAWHDQAGDVDRAIRHALLAGDVTMAGAAACRGAARAITQGQAATVARRLACFTDEQIARSPMLALTAAGCQLSRGRGDVAGHWVLTAAGAACAAQAPAECGISLLRAVLARDGLAAARQEAAWAYALLPDASPWRALAALVEGTASYLAGDPDEATRRLEDGACRAAVALPAVHALCLAQLAVLAHAREDDQRAAELSRRARAQVEGYGLAEDATVALVFATSALARADRGSTDAANDDLERGSRLYRRLTDFPHWYEAEVGILLARAAVRLGDVDGACGMLAEAERRLDRSPESILLFDQIRETRAHIEAFHASGPEAASLTPAELRVLQFLPSHLSFREIAERSFVSTHTIKSQANAVYRKLGARCRSDAVVRARGCGLLGE